MAKLTTDIPRHCDKCTKSLPVPPQTGGTGYGRTPEGSIHCYDCCGDNWPGTLSIPVVGQPNIGRHNIAGIRRDVWFCFEGANWHGAQYGNNSDLVRCRKLKPK